ncbi:MBL fold metallo-hydrolase [Alkalicoccus urumqiensis]|uniref:Zn-dependent hydrolase n=1 Tax=Alkalicoccus urumqiensis TaxID=1548213 RepID=A0A2P6MGV1_ALKUR|nr:MBL fold metallo-hydrolase [Alkalicoccus urumqiensis]PRO65508.1 Zn-dependent hydrolase [Alkalicoccus urumqiensis]
MVQEIKHIGKRIVYLTPVEETDRPILAAVQGKSRTLLIDAGNSEDHVRLFLDHLTRLGIPAPTLAAITHHHWDHIFGMAALTRTPTIATAQTAREIERMKQYMWDDASLDKRVEEGTEISFCADAIKKEFPHERSIRVVTPTITFEQQSEIDLGDVHVTLQHVGGDHSPDGLTAYVHEEKTLFLGDALAPDMYAPSWRFTPEKTISMLDKMEAFDAETYVISHWKPVTKEVFQEEADLLRFTAEQMIEHHGDEAEVRRRMENEFGTPLSEEEELALEYFHNGRK